MTQCNVSIIIPIYNQEEYISECLESAISQDMDNLEILCIDDGSTDNSVGMVRSYMLQDARINLLTQENKGVSQTRNRGIRCAKGDYVIFCDPDDFYPHPTTISALYEAAISNGAVVVGGSFSRYDDRTGSQTTQFDGMYEGYSFPDSGFIQYTDYQFDYGFHRFLFQRDFLLENGLSFPDYKRFQDPPFLVAALYAASSFYAIPDIVYRYRKNHTSVKWTVDKALDLGQGILDIIAFSAENNLWNLHALTVNRIDIEHREVFSRYTDDMRVLELLAEINSMINWTEIAGMRLSSETAPKELILPLDDAYTAQSRNADAMEGNHGRQFRKRLKRRLTSMAQRITGNR